MTIKGLGCKKIFLPSIRDWLDSLLFQHKLPLFIFGFVREYQYLNDCKPVK